MHFIVATHSRLAFSTLVSFEARSSHPSVRSTTAEPSPSQGGSIVLLHTLLLSSVVKMSPIGQQSRHEA